MKNNTVLFIVNVKPLKLNVIMDCYLWHPFFVCITIFDLKWSEKKQFGYESLVFYVKNRIEKECLLFYQGLT